MSNVRSIFAIKRLFVVAFGEIKPYYFDYGYSASNYIVLMLMESLLIRIFCFFLMSFAHISASQSSTNYQSVEKNCWNAAGERYQINPFLLYAIAEKESSFDPIAVNARNVMDEDVGLMQINSFWYSYLRNHGISRNDLFHPCTSIHAGAWVLAQSIRVFGNTWEAVGAYNVGTSKEEWAYKARGKYAKDVRRRYFTIVERLRDTTTTE